MIQIDHSLQAADLSASIRKLWDLSAAKIQALETEYDKSKGSPVFTIDGKYTTRGWTEWTQGFQFGSALLQFDATGEAEFLEIGRKNTVEVMAPHVTHVGVHDHGFNNVSTYGNLRRLMNEGKIDEDPWQRNFYELALKASGAVQARRWTDIADGGGYIYSFNGPHSLFADTIRSCRALAVSHMLGHVLQGENDVVINLLGRLIGHMRSTAKYSTYYGEGRDSYDVWGRVAHESVFNLNDGNFRCPNSQQGFSPFTTWTRGLAWVMTGMAEELEYLATRSDGELAEFGGRDDVVGTCLKAARATCDFYIDHTPTDGVCYWDTGAPNLHKLGDYLDRPAEPCNDHEPVDSSASAIGAQGLLRLGKYLTDQGQAEDGKKYTQAGLTVARTLFDEPYLSTDTSHHGLLLHSVYHRPNGWDNIPDGRKVPCNESSMWGDYHARELALYIQRLTGDEPYLTFWGGR
ncbi:MAG: glycosyl hydrolase [Phycisphaerae bacterium]